MNEQSESWGYGVSKTKRCTVPDAEDMLGSKLLGLQYGSTMLVDYMGGDAAIINSATNFRGLNAVGGMAPQDFMIWLRSKGILKPFRFAELKVAVTAPITAALTIVPFEGASVNEYSGRYSVMVDECQNPCEGDLGAVVERLYDRSRERYHRLISSEVDLARELARSVMPLSNYTSFYWKVNLEQLFGFLRENPHPGEHLAPFVDHLRLLARRIAPLAYEAFLAVDEHGEKSKYGMGLSFSDADVLRVPQRLDDPYEVSETRRLTVEGAENHLFRHVPVLDRGWVRFVDYMGGDESVVQAARVSYGRGTRKVQEDAGLIRYLARHHHTTPSEMIELAWAMKLPFFVERQLVRHRALDKVGFLDGFVVDPEVYIPERDELRAQSRTNRQGRGVLLEERAQDEVLRILGESRDDHARVSQELRRIGFNSAFVNHVAEVGAYTGWTLKGDVKNLQHFFGLRLDAHAQKESQAYGQAMARVLQDACPVVFEAFQDYQLQATSLSRIELGCLRRILAGEQRETVVESITNKREREEFLNKLSLLFEAEQKI